jgi:RimJ/RimL family protein N-acetyltransferase
MRLETERLVLRRFSSLADRDAFADICRDPEVMDWLGGVLDREGADRRIDRSEATFEARGHGRFLVERKADGEVLGWCGIMPAHDNLPLGGQPEIGWRLARPAWGQSYATEMARAVFEDGFRRLGFKEVLAFTSAHNVRSQAVMTRLGLVREPQRDFLYPSLPEGDPHRQSVVFVAYP